MVRILESYLDGKKGKLIIDVVDSEGELQKLIDHIKKTANIGHSFEVVVDPDNKDYTEKFYIDGDGSFHIKDVEFEKEDDEKEKKEESVKTVDAFKKEHNLTDDDIDELKQYYENPWNEHRDLTFVDYLYALVDNNLLPEMLSESVKTIYNFKKENKLSNEMINTLKEFYDSDQNIYFKDLDFISWLYAIKTHEGGTIYSEILEDYIVESKIESIQPSGNIIEALDDMLKAMDNVTELWAKNPEWDDVLSNKEYPFEEDFDRVVKNVSYWVEECKK